MRCLVAYARHIAGAPPVRRHQLLDRSARLKARRILACGYTHTPCGDSPARPFFQASYAPGFAADEDIAEGRIGLDTARETMRDLLRSKRGHGEALIDPRWRDIGVAQRNGRLGGDRSGIWVIHVGMRRAR